MTFWDAVIHVMWAMVAYKLTRTIDRAVDKAKVSIKKELDVDVTTGEDDERAQVTKD